jgi:hypothetical protein
MQEVKRKLDAKRAHGSSLLRIDADGGLSRKTIISQPERSLQGFSVTSTH